MGVLPLRRIAFVVAGLACFTAFAQPTEAPEGGADIAELDLESLLDQAVVSSTKTEARGAQAPAVISVITGEEIRARGYTSLAEVLFTVPGVYDVFDLVTHNVGVRGINGGVRASGNVVKLLIDGQPVDYRPTTGNFFGEELIPLVAVERVEVIRGPASALYGANAFLGVVNVITRSGASAQGLTLMGHGGVVGSRLLAGGGALLAGQEDNVEMLLAVHGMYADRSGLSPGPTSPALTTPNSAVPRRGVSEVDLSRPRSIFGKAGATVAGGRASFLASVQSLDSVSEFGDIAPLTHGTRVSLVNQNYRLSYQRDLSDDATVEVSASYFTGGPTAKDRLDIDHPDHVLLRRSGVQGYGVAAEGRYGWGSVTLVGGADFTWEQHSVLSYDRLLTTDLYSPEGALLKESGTIIPSSDPAGVRIFRNTGVFAQLIYPWSESISAVVGARLDKHNIYDHQPSARAALVYAPPDRPMSLKLLYGSSFKAPSADQLYATSSGAIDVIGNPDLKSQRAHTFEVAGGYRFGTGAELVLNVFATNVAGRIEFVRRGFGVQAQNILDEWVSGGELEGRFRPTPKLDLRISADVARSVVRSPGPLLAALPPVVNPLFPTYQTHVLAAYELPYELNAGAELSYIGARQSSQSNALLAGRAYDVPGYVMTALSLDWAKQFWGERDTRLSLRVTNLLGVRYAEPGFGGVDSPGLGRTVVFSWSQSL